MIVPIPQPPPQCPRCRRVEDTKTMCRHCGYEYPEGSYPPAWLIVVVVVGIVVAAGAAFFTLMNWAMCWHGDEAKCGTLVRSIVTTGRFFLDLARRLW